MPRQPWVWCPSSTALPSCLPWRWRPPISTICAQNIGADRFEDQAVKTCWIGTGIAAISVLIFLVTRIFPAEIIALFNRDPELVGYGVVYIEHLLL